MWRIATYLGVANLSAIAAGLVYIFFILPTTAAEQARAQIQAQSAALTSKFIESAAVALVDTGKSQANAALLTERGKEIDRQFKELQTKFDAVKGTSAEQLADLVAKLKALPDLGKNLELVSAVQKLEGRLNSASSTASIGYGRGAWSNTSKSAVCLAGQVAVGIEVIYGGTCNSQCNADGGVVQEIKVVCRAL